MGISTHILNTAEGRPAAGVPVRLEIHDGEVWAEIGRSETDADGRCRSLIPEGREVEAGIYRLRFETAAYFTRMEITGLYPWVEIVFEAKSAGESFHIPLLLTANGYTTYRGS